MGATASTPRPTDFPLGSPESRAAARAMLTSNSAMTPYDEDCYWVYEAVCHINVMVSPSWNDIVPTDAYQRGQEIDELRNGPVIPAHLDTKFNRQTSASIFFTGIHHKDPVPGDILRYEDVARILAPERLAQVLRTMQEAWKRRLPEFPFPFKVDGRTFYKRTSDGKGKITWVKDERWNLYDIWGGVEADALGRQQFDPPRPPAIRSVVFVESKDGKYRTKPVGKRKAEGRQDRRRRTGSQKTS